MTDLKMPAANERFGVMWQETNKLKKYENSKNDI